MEDLKGLVKECIKIKTEQFQTNEKVKIVGAKYFVILENGEIKQSDFDPILNQSGIEFAFIFPKIHYTPNVTYWEDSYLSPIIINQILEAVDEKLMINNWIFEFKGQNIKHAAHHIQMNISNNKFGYMESFYPVLVEELIEMLKLFMTLLKCSTKTEALYMVDLHKKGIQIDSLSNKVSRLEADMHIKNLTIESYKELLNSIKELVASKQ